MGYKVKSVALVFNKSTSMAEEEERWVECRCTSGSVVAYVCVLVVIHWTLDRRENVCL